MKIAALLPAVVLAVGALAVGLKVHARRRAANTRVSGGRKSLVLNLFDRS